MNVTNMVADLNREIARLTQIRDLLEQVPTETEAPRRGRPKGSTNKPAEAVKKRRVLSEEARAKIAAAQRIRWAKTNADAAVTADDALSGAKAAKKSVVAKSNGGKKASAKKSGKPAPGKTASATPPALPQESGEAVESTPTE